MTNTNTSTKEDIYFNSASFLNQNLDEFECELNLNSRISICKSLSDLLLESACEEGENEREISLCCLLKTQIEEIEALYNLQLGLIKKNKTLIKTELEN